MLKRLTIYFLLILLSLMHFPMSAQTSTIPTTILVQANGHFFDSNSFDGTIKMDIGIYEEDVDDTALWETTFNSIQVFNGSFSVILGEDGSLSADIFIYDNLRIGFTPYENGVAQSTEFIDLMSVPYSFHSQISYAAQKLYNEDLIYLDTTNIRVGINNTNPSYALDVGGTVNAIAFVGDGSGLTNIQVSDDRLVWNQGDPITDIYYTSGNVGIGTDSPSALLEVSGNAIISGNLTVTDEIDSAFLSGDGSGITNINASNITSGTLSSDRISGSYTGITGVGTLTEGTWQGTPITDDYIANNLTLDGATIEGTNTISGNINIVGDTVFSGDYPMSVDTSFWSISQEGLLDIDSVTINNSIIIYDNIIESIDPEGLHIRPSGYSGLYISPTGSIGINTTAPQSMLDVNGGIKLGYTEEEIDGMIRYNPYTERFEAFSDNAWLILDAKSDYDSHALHNEDGTIENLVYVTDEGNVGIGGIPSADITEDFMVSGNVIFKGAYTGAGDSTELSFSGPGSRMIWYPLKSSFRAGYADDDEWDSDNIGTNSVAFGDSNLADEYGTTIIGGKGNSVSGRGSVIVGGFSNIIESNSEFNVIVGGGSSYGGGNSISDSATYSTILGGYSNAIDGANYSSIIGGSNNTISGDNSVAIGSDITIEHNNTIIFSDGYEPRSSSGDNQFLIYATGNVGISAAPLEDYSLNVGGTIRAMGFIGDGSQLYNISATQISGYYSATTASPNSIYISDANGYLPGNTVNSDTIEDGSIDSSDILDGSITGDDIGVGAITADKIIDGSITSEKIADGAITGDKLQDNAITSSNIVDGGIVSDNIAEDSIYEYHIVDLQVTNAKIAIDTIDTDRIVDGTITSMDIGLKEIASFNIQDDAITSRNIAYATIVSDNIAANAIQWQHITPNAVSSRNIADNAVLSYHILDYSIDSDHISENAILSIHIADEVITNERILDNSITSEKIASDSITSDHLPNLVIASHHIASRSVLSYHIGLEEIDGALLADYTIVSSNIADSAITTSKIATDAITSDHILNGTIQGFDIAEYELGTEYFAENSITSLNIADGGIGSSNIADNSITGENIIDGSITADDISFDSITSDYIEDGSITSENIADSSILSEHIADDAITSANIADGSITWDKVSSDDYLPIDYIEDGSITGEKLADDSITGDNIEDGSITSDHLADESISSNALIGVVSVSNGGTGTDSLAAANGAVVYVADDAFTGDPNNLYWDFEDHYLGIGTNSPEYSLHVNGNLLTEGGSVYFGDENNSISFSSSEFWNNTNGFIIIGPNDTSDIDNSIPQGTVKISQLYVSNKLGVGQGFDSSGPSNTLAVSGNMSIGSTYATSAAPESGLIIEGDVGIGTDSPAYQLDVNGGIKASGIYGLGTGDGIGIYADGGSTGISVNSEVGIDVTGEEFGIKALANGANGQGIQVTVTNPANNSFGIEGVVENDSGSELVSGAIGYYTSSDIAAIYGSATGTNTETETYWAGYFDGAVKISDDIAIGTATSPEATLHVGGSALIEETISIAENEASSTSIDWTSSNKYYYDCSSSISFSFSNTNTNVRVLNLRVISGSGCGISSFPAEIKWEKAYDTSLLSSLSDGSTYIFSFFYDGSTYYGMEPLEFQ